MIGNEIYVKIKPQPFQLGSFFRVIISDRPRKVRTGLYRVCGRMAGPEDGIEITAIQCDTTDPKDETVWLVTYKNGHLELFQEAVCNSRV